MPPKLTPLQIDAKLDDLNSYVRRNADELATTSAQSLVGVLFVHHRRCADAKKFAKFLRDHEHKFSSAQALRTLSMLELFVSSSQQQEQKQEQHKQHQERSRAEKASSASASASGAASSAHATSAPLDSATSARSKRSTPSLGEKPSKKHAEKFDCAAESFAAPAKKAAKKAPLLEIFARQKRTHAETSATDTGESPASPATMVSFKVALKIRVDALRKELKGKGANLPEFEVRDLTHAVIVLQKWLSDPGHKRRDAMAKLATAWKVKRTVRTGRGKTIQRPSLEIAQDLEHKLSLNVKKLLDEDGERHSHYLQTSSHHIDSK